MTLYRFALSLPPKSRTNMENSKTLNPLQKTVVGVQFLFVAFGATVLVPLWVGIDPSTALFTAGIGLSALLGVVLNLVLPRDKN